MHVDPLFMQLPDGINREDYVIATYYIQTSRDAKAVKYICALAVEQTSGTWLPVPYETPGIREKHLGRVIGVYEMPAFYTEPPESVTERTMLIRIAFPTRNFGPKFATLFTTVLGNLTYSSKLKLMDLEFPESFLKEFKGPKFGIQGIRELLGVYDRPLVNNMVKPCIGLDPKQTAKYVYEVAVGGVDIIKDDELTSDPPNCPCFERLKEVMKALKAADEEKGEKTLYTLNITDRTEKLRDNALRAIELGANALMVNTWTIGLDAARMLAEEPEINVPILSHPDMQGAISMSPYSGMSIHLANCKLPRLAGLDIAMLLNSCGKFPFAVDTCVINFHTMIAPMKHIKPQFPAVGAGITQGHIEELNKEFGADIIIGAGGAIAGHPMGSTAGGKAFRQGIDAVMKGATLREACEDPNNKELKAAIDAWGVYGEKNNFDLVTK